MRYPAYPAPQLPRQRTAIGSSQCCCHKSGNNLTAGVPFATEAGGTPPLYAMSGLRVTEVGPFTRGLKDAPPLFTTLRDTLALKLTR